MHVQDRSVGHQAVLIAAFVSLTACGGTSRINPTALPQSGALSPGSGATAENSRPASAAPQRTSVSPLVGGSFAILNTNGDGIQGTYTGTVQVRATEEASLTLEISGGSGTFAGAAGSLSVRGSGSFVDEGAFLLHGQGDIRIAGGHRSVLTLFLRGNASVGCSAGGQIIVSQFGAGTMPGAGSVTATLQHTVANTGCSP